MKRRSFLKSLAVIGGSIAIVPQMGLTLIEQREKEQRGLSHNEMVRMKMQEMKFRLERAFIMGTI